MNLWWVFHFTPVVFGVVYILLGIVSQIRTSIIWELRFSGSLSQAALRKATQ